MGSYSQSRTYATSNAPAVQDNENPFVLTGNSGVNLGGTTLSVSKGGSVSNGNVNLAAGASINELDGGAINSAFSFAGDAITKLFDLTSKTIEQNKTNTADFMNQVASNQQESLGIVGALQDDAGQQTGIVKMVLIGGAVLVGLFVVLKFSKWGK